MQHINSKQHFPVINSEKKVKAFTGCGRKTTYRGFSLFEMVVTICAIVILYMVVEQRLNTLPAAAERANFFGVLQQIKTGVNLEMVTKLAAGQSSDIFLLEGRNPISFLIEKPTNYQGEVLVVDEQVARRAAWYFETSTQHLVYVIGNSSRNDVLVKVADQMVNRDQLHFKLENHYVESVVDFSKGYAAHVNGIGNAHVEKKSWQGLILQEVAEYHWERRSEKPLEIH